MPAVSPSTRMRIAPFVPVTRNLALRGVQTEEARNTGQAIANNRRIVNFAQKNDLQIKKITCGEYSILLIDEEGTQDIDEERILKLFQFYEQIKGTIFNNCLDIAGRAVQQHIAQGCIGTQSGAYSFIEYHNHYCNYLWLPDQSTVSVDFTAGKNINKNNGDFHILAIRAHDVGSLWPKLDKLYGGHWNVN